MYLHIGQSVVVPYRQILGIFDLDNASWAFKTREFLERAEAEGRAVWVCDDLPRSFVLEGRAVWLGDDLPRSFILVGEGNAPPTVYISQLSTATLLRRMENNSFE